MNRHTALDHTMPRLRIKSPNGTIQRVQVADDCTLQQLKESVAQQVSLQSVASEVRLSLNKKARSQAVSVVGMADSIYATVALSSLTPHR